MPNHVTNRVLFEGEQDNINKVLNLIKGNAERPVIDFNKIIPMPDYIYRGNLGREERKKYGANNWYDWSLANWGTKWNAYYQSVYGNEITFSTAWAMPEGIYRKLSEICQEYDVEFTGEWCNEDWSSDSGEFEATEGSFYYEQDETIEEHKNRCISLMGFDPDEEEEE